MESKNPIATAHLTNSTGIAIFEINEDTVETAFHNGTEYSKLKTTKLYNVGINPYFIRYNTKYFINDFMRTNY